MGRKKEYNVEILAVDCEKQWGSGRSYPSRMQGLNLRQRGEAICEVSRIVYGKFAVDHGGMWDTCRRKKENRLNSPRSFFV
jgi:hypothetical protein